MFAKRLTRQHHLPTHQRPHSPPHLQRIPLVLPLGFKMGLMSRKCMDALTTVPTLVPHRYVTRGDVSSQEEVGITRLDKHNFVMTAGQLKPCTWSSPRAFGPLQLPSPFVRSLHISPARRAKENKTLFCCENYFIPHQKKRFQLHENMLPPCTPSKMLLTWGVRHKCEGQTLWILSL